MILSLLLAVACACFVRPALTKTTCSEPASMYIHHRVPGGDDYADEFDVGTVLRYECGPGYFPRNIKTWKATCVRKHDDSLDWEIEENDCRPVSCGHPGEVRWGRLLDAVFAFPRRVRYQCNHGYRLVGEANLYCQSDARWSAPKPECRIVDCGPLEDIPNGRVKLSGTEFAFKAEFECSRCFRIVGNSTRTCDADGKWTGTSPRCEEILCEAPELPRSGGSSSIGPEDGPQRCDTKIDYTCPAGTTLVGSNSNSCLETGIWLFDPPTCAYDCHIDKLPLVEHGHPLERQSVSHDSVAQYYCEEPFTLRNSKQLRCRFGSWEGKPPTCIRAYCTVPDTPSATVLRVPRLWSLRNIKKAVKPGEKVPETDESLVVKCNNGFHFRNGYTGSVYLRCEGGQWLPREPWCSKVVASHWQGKGCVFPRREGRFKAYRDHERIRSGMLVPHGAELKFHCEPIGIIIFKGSRTSTCINGSWTEELPYCYNITSDIIFMELKTNNYIGPGGIAYVEPYREVNVQCWTTQHVELSLEAKTSHGNPRVGYVELGYKLTGIQATFILAPNESTEVICRHKDRNRSPTRSIAVVARYRYTCIMPSPGTSTPNILRKNRETYEFSCAPHLVLQGRKRLHCLVYGEWDNDLPTCLAPSSTAPDPEDAFPPRVVSPSPTPASPARYNCPGFSYRSRGLRVLRSNEQVIEFECEAPYQLRGQNRVYCETHSQSWSGPFPSCDLAPTSPELQLQRTTPTTRVTPAPLMANHRNNCMVTAVVDGHFARRLKNGTLKKIKNGKQLSDGTETYLQCNTTNKPIKCVDGTWRPHPACGNGTQPVNERMPSYNLQASREAGPIEGSIIETVDGAVEHAAGIKDGAVAGNVNPALNSEGEHGLGTAPVSSEADQSSPPRCLPLDLCISAQEEANVTTNATAPATDGTSSFQRSTRSPEVLTDFTSGSTPTGLSNDSRMAAPFNLSEPGILTVPPTAGVIVLDLRHRPVERVSIVSAILSQPDEEKTIEATDTSTNYTDVGLKSSEAKIDVEAPIQGGAPGISALTTVQPAETVNFTTTAVTLPTFSDPAEAPAPQLPIDPAGSNGCLLSDFFEVAHEGIAINFDTTLVPPNTTLSAFCYESTELITDVGPVTCLQNGSWDVPAHVKCIKGCVNFETGPDGPVVEERKDSYRLGDGITFSCKNGTKLDPHIERMMCLGNEQGWSENRVPTCIPVQKN